MYIKKLYSKKIVIVIAGSQGQNASIARWSCYWLSKTKRNLLVGGFLYWRPPCLLDWSFLDWRTPCLIDWGFLVMRTLGFWDCWTWGQYVKYLNQQEGLIALVLAMSLNFFWILKTFIETSFGPLSWYLLLISQSSWGCKLYFPFAKVISSTMLRTGQGRPRW